MKGLARFFGMNSETDKKPEQQPEAVLPEENVANTNGVEWINSSQIVPNPYQPRKNFTEDALTDLAASIQKYGILQPLLVRKTAAGYELIAGERRLRASKLAGLTEVPVLIREMNEKETAEIAMIENLQREDLHFLEEAEGFAQLLQNFGFTQEVLAERMSKSQSTVANKLRLLKLSPEIRQEIFTAGLTERHARALLRVPDEKQQNNILQAVIEKDLNVRETEELIKKYLDGEPVKSKRRVQGLIRDVRIYLNTIDQLTKQMKESGLKVKVSREQSEDFITVKMVIPKNKK